jgi:GGDEF domain-containing protein
MTNLPGTRLAFGAAAVASTLACLADLVASPLLGAALATISAVLILGGLVAGARRGSGANEALVRQLRESAEAGRKPAIYEREAGLLAHRYLSLRGKEECDRAARYNRPLTLLLVEPAPESNTRAVQGQLAEWLKRKVRSVDIAGYLGNGRFVLLMPETDIAAAMRAVARLQDDIAEVQTGLSAFGADGVTFDNMYAAAWQTLEKSSKQAA